jgi:SAM-dependent methyltransferase
MTEVFELPETFTSDDVGHPLLLNTGLWVCRFDPAWNRELHFEINDRIVLDARTNTYRPEVEPEDWFFSRLCHELGLRIGATRKVLLQHRGAASFPNIGPWGHPFDREYIDASQLPPRDERRGEHYQKIQGYFDFEHFYSQIADELPHDGRFVEVGCWRGQSLAYLLGELKRRQKQVDVVGVDHFEGALGDMPFQQMAQLNDIEAECRENLKAVGYPFGIIAKPSVDAARDIDDESLDAVFIDGSHDYESVRDDLLAWIPKVKRGGILAGHDYQDRGVAQAIAEVMPVAQIEQSPRPESMGGVRWGVCWRTRL